MYICVCACVYIYIFIFIFEGIMHSQNYVRVSFIWVRKLLQFIVLTYNWVGQFLTAEYIKISHQRDLKGA
jgi:hypothetical protein